MCDFTPLIQGIKNFFIEIYDIIGNMSVRKKVITEIDLISGQKTLYNFSYNKENRISLFKIIAIIVGSFISLYLLFSAYEAHIKHIAVKNYKRKSKNDNIKKEN